MTCSAEPTLIFETVHGSRAYGLDEASSDTDLKGIVVGPPAWYFGVDPAPEQLTLTKDHVRYELRKFMRLAVAANPTIFEMLWTDEAHHTAMTPAGERLLGARELFLSLKVEQTFGGYALSQLKRIRTHRRWLLRPPGEEPRREAFGLPERTVIPRDQRGAAEQLLARGQVDEADLSPNFLDALERERRYRSARKEWEQYKRWRKERNPARAGLEAKYGYDTKHALHLVRLLRMGVEILEHGQVAVRREDRDELLAIKHGAWPYDQVVEHAEQLRGRMAALKEQTPLPPACDEAAVNALCVALITQVLREDT